MELKLAEEARRLRAGQEPEFEPLQLATSRTHQQEWFGVRTLLPLAASSGVLMASGRYCPRMSNSQCQL